MADQPIQPRTFEDSAFEAVARCLRKVTVPDSDATVAYDMMSDGLIWSDERAGMLRVPFEHLGIVRCLLNYRASLISRQPREEFAGVWERGSEAFPYWIGFLPERCESSDELVGLLTGFRTRSQKEFDRL